MIKAGSYKPATHFTSIYGISAAALRGWATTGRLDHLRTPGDKRLYRVDGVTNLLGVTASETTKRGYIYARVSSAKQRPDLDRQIADLQQAYPKHVLVKDIASGVNFKRLGLRTLLEHALVGMVSEVVVMHRDRLARLGYDLLEFIFSKVGVRLVVHGRDEGAEGERDLADDLLAVTTLFVASHNGRRAAANRKRRREGATEKRTGRRTKENQASQDRNTKSEQECTTKESV